MVIHKIGIVPLARMGGEVRALIHKPRAKDGETDIAWGLARGTRMYFDGKAWVDARDRSIAEANEERLEALVETARREMEEELDVREAEMEGGLVDIGTITYDSAMKGAYPIHWFSGWVTTSERLRAPVDAVAVEWVSLEGLHAMAKDGRFKASYLPIVEAVVRHMV